MDSITGAVSRLLGRLQSTGLTSRVRALFAKRLSLYLGAGVPIAEALSLLTADERSRGMFNVLTKLYEAVTEGRTLSSGLMASRREFGSFAIALIEVGEVSGTLRESLAHVSTALRKQELLRKKLVGSIIYPAILLVSTAGIAAFLTLYAFPKIVPLFRGFDASLPISTRILIYISDTADIWCPVLVVAIAGCSIAYAVLMQRPRVRLLRDRLLIGTPILGSLIMSYCLASIARTLATLLDSELRIVPSIELASEVSGNMAYHEALLETRDEVMAGIPLSSALEHQRRCFPTMFIQIVRTGERTGTLSASFAALSEEYEERSDDLNRQLSTLIEPVLMIWMGLTVGFIALAIITPVYRVTQGMSL